MNVLMQFLGFFVGLEKFVLVPLVIFVLAMIFGVKPKTALKSSFLFGAGLLGIITIANVMYQYMGNVATGLINNAHSTHDMLDVGMSGLFGAVVSLPFFIFLFPIGITVNLILISVGWTKTFDIDFLTYFGFLLAGLPVYFLTGSWIWELVIMIIYFAVCLKIADWTAPMLADYYGVEGVSIPHNSCGFQAILVIPLNWLIDKIPGLRDIDFNIGTLNNKLGIFGDPAMISFLIGTILGLVSGAGISASLAVGMVLVFTCYLYPKAIGLMMEGLQPISAAMREFGKSKLHRDDLYMGMDAAIFAGYPEVVAVTSLYIPIALALYFFWPGSRVIPTGESIQLAIVIGMIMPFAGKAGHKGNVFRTLLIGAILCIIGIYASQYVAPITTDLCKATGYDLGSFEQVLSFGMRDLPTTLVMFICNLLHLG